MAGRKRKEFTDKQILSAARQVANGRSVAEVSADLGISVSTFQRWRRHHGTDAKLRRKLGRTYTMDDLRREMDLSRRAIAGYVENGLLDPPVGFGPNTHYLGKHLVRL